MAFKRGWGVPSGRLRKKVALNEKPLRRAGGFRFNIRGGIYIASIFSNDINRLGVYLIPDCFKDLIKSGI